MKYIVCILAGILFAAILRGFGAPVTYAGNYGLAATGICLFFTWRDDAPLSESEIYRIFRRSINRIKRGKRVIFLR